MQLAPMARKHVPVKAARARKMKNEARFGDRAVPTEKEKNRTAEVVVV